MLAACLAVILALPQPRPEITYHVSPSGSDENPGTLAGAPLKTVRKAFERIEQDRARQDARERAIRVEFAAGTYELSETLEVLIGHGGSKDCPTTCAAAEGAAVVFSGGTRLRSWRQVALDGRTVFATPLPENLRGPAADGRAFPFRSLWVNGKLRPWARTPDGGSFFRVAAFPDDQPKGDWTKGQSAFIYAEADAPAWEKIGPGAEVTTFTRWVDTHLRVLSVDRDSRTVRFASPNIFALAPGNFYCIQGGRPAFDVPGEWWYDPGAGTVYAAPMEGENFTDDAAEVIVPRLETLMHVRGDDQLGPAHHITFRGITFAHARWWFPQAFKGTWPSAEVIGFPQAAVGVPGAVRVENAHDVAFEDCTFEHIEGYGVEFGRAVKDCAMRRCTVRDLGAGGIKIGETAMRQAEPERTGGNVIEDCTITDGGHIHHQAVGVWIGQSGGNRLSHNLISEFDYTGISIGWTWGYGPARAAGNTVEFNEVRNLGARPGNAEPPLGDMGGIYTLGIQGPTADAPDQSAPRTTIRNNFFHDIAGHTIAWGIYFDEGSTGIVAENNIVLRTTHGGFHQHYGRDNVVRNNILAFGRDHQFWRTRREDHNSFTFANNIVIGDSDVWMNGDWSDHFVIDKNLHWRTSGKPIVFPGNRDFAAWQAAGHDAGSIIADPLFQDAAAGNFKLKSASPAPSIGFNAIDLSEVGPRAPKPR